MERNTNEFTPPEDPRNWNMLDGAFLRYAEAKQARKEGQTVTVRQHMVPQFYQKNFSGDKKLIHIFDKDVNYWATIPIIEAFCGRNAYECEGLWRNAFEDDICTPIEENFKKPLKRIINNGTLKGLPELWRGHICRFVSLQCFRTLKWINFMESVMALCSNFSAELKLTPYVFNPSRDLGVLSLFRLYTSSKSLNRLNSRGLTLLESPFVDLCTSDNPVALALHRNDASYILLDGQIDEPRSVIYLPISPRYCLCLSPTTGVNAGLSKNHVSISDNFANLLNKFQIANSTKHLASLSPAMSITNYAVTQPALFQLDPSQSIERLRKFANDLTLEVVKEHVNIIPEDIYNNAVELLEEISRSIPKECGWMKVC